MICITLLKSKSKFSLNVKICAFANHTNTIDLLAVLKEECKSNVDLYLLKNLDCESLRIEAEMPQNRMSSISMNTNVARSKLSCKMASRSISIEGSKTSDTGRLGRCRLARKVNDNLCQKVNKNLCPCKSLPL